MENGNAYVDYWHIYIYILAKACGGLKNAAHSIRLYVGVVIAILVRRHNNIYLTPWRCFLFRVILFSLSSCVCVFVCVYRENKSKQTIFFVHLFTYTNI